jgi:hypothetical protein
MLSSSDVRDGYNTIRPHAINAIFAGRDQPPFGGERANHLANRCFIV